MDCNSLWCYYTQSGVITNVISGRNTTTPINWRTGPGVLYNNLPYISFQSHFLNSNTYGEISRFDIYNIIKIELIINRYSQDKILGEFSVSYKNSNGDWIEIHKIDESDKINERSEWETITSISENNYGLRIRHDKKNSTNQMCSISKITLTHTI